MIAVAEAIARETTTVGMATEVVEAGCKTQIATSRGEILKTKTATEIGHGLETVTVMSAGTVIGGSVMSVGSEAAVAGGVAVAAVAAERAPS